MQTTIKDVLVKIKDHLNRKKGDNVFASLSLFEKDEQKDEVIFTLLRIEEEDTNSSNTSPILYYIFNIK